MRILFSAPELDLLRRIFKVVWPVPSLAPAAMAT
jgi:hypothetical protein